MKSFITMVFVYLTLEVIARIVYMTLKEWPHEHTRTIGDFASTTCLLIAAIVWAGFLLFS